MVVFDGQNGAKLMDLAKEFDIFFEDARKIFLVNEITGSLKNKVRQGATWLTTLRPKKLWFKSFMRIQKLYFGKQ